MPMVSDKPNAAPQPPACIVRRHHRDMLAISLAAIVLAFLLRVAPLGGVYVCGYSRMQLPPLCGSQILFNVECPGCGLTRSCVLLAHGDWRGAWAMNRVGWLFAIMIVLQVPYRVWAMGSATGRPLGRRAPRIFGYLLIAALIGNWLLRQFGV